MKFPSLVIAASFAASAFSQAALVTHYTFEGTGNDMAGSRNLTITDGSYSSNTPGGTGQSLAFNGTSTRAVYDVIGTDSLSGSYTVAMYVNYNSASGPTPGVVRSFFGTRAPTDFGFDAKFVNGNVVHGDAGNGTAWVNNAVDAPLNYSLNTWYHIAYSFTPTTFTIFINGNQAATGSLSGSTLLFDATHDIAVGNRGSTGLEWMSGLIDDVRIYNTALTQSEVRAFLVPEPASASLLLLGLIGAARRRRRE